MPGQTSLCDMLYINLLRSLDCKQIPVTWLGKLADMSERSLEDKEDFLGLLERLGIDEVIKQAEDTCLNEGSRIKTQSSGPR